MRSMKKYTIGIIILCVLTLGLAGYVVMLGLSSRQDVKTEKSEQEVSEKLNTYVTKNNRVPDNLEEAGAKDVPSSIRYKKLSSAKYEVCVTYKAVKGYGGGDISSVVTGAIISNMYGAGRNGSFGYDSGSYTPSAYYPSYTHTKGETCQTVEPYIQPDYTSTSPAVDDSAYCDASGQYYELYKSYCVNGKLEFN